jgi:hypothetical protein
MPFKPFFLRSEIDEHERRVLTTYTTECWEVWILRVTLIGDRPWITFNGPIASPDTVNQFVETLLWAKQFTQDGGVVNFNTCWVSQPLEASCAKKITGWGRD